MRSHLPFNSRTVMCALCGIVLAMGAVVNSAKADQWDKKTILTVDQPIQVRDNLLQPGTYVFKLLNSSSDRHIVQIFNSDQSRIIDTVLAIPNYRLEPTGDSRFAFWETPPGTAKALRAWFYPGDNYGQEFPHPKHFIQLQASASTTTTPAPQVSQPAPPAPPVVTQPAEPQPLTQEPQKEETQPPEMAQAPPPPPSTPPPPATEPPPPPPESLPKTGSPYPLIGLSGLFSLGLYGLLRLRRQA
ncbi:MAG TPA: LPXTG cell wall anchor domain-containing protein [Bryobacteraceae bacterium]|nr:LPXTG cell wall anchor domain-containing protein [Bryobacteraceae bacterium]